MRVRTLGVLMLETSFLRIPGDIGNPETFDFPVEYAVVAGADPRRVVWEQDERLVQLFADAARGLIGAGVTAMTTSCGFLACFQDELAARISVPFVASALSYLEVLRESCRRVAVITADAGALTPPMYPRNGLDPVAVVGMETAPAFRSAILEGTADLAPEAIAQEVVDVVTQLAALHPAPEAVILECTNLPPYRDAIREVLPVPIFDITTLARSLVQHQELRVDCDSSTSGC